MYTFSQTVANLGLFQNDSHAKAAMLGLVLQKLSELPNYNNSYFSEYAGLVRAAIDAKQAEIYFDRQYRFIGHVIWADFSPEIEQYVLTHASSRQFGGALQSGRQRWILSLAIAPGFVPAILADLRDRIMLDIDRVTYFRYKRGKRIAKRMESSAFSSFFNKRQHRLIAKD